MQRFQTSPDIPLFMLTTGVGGVGLTLTAADRVIIVDPSWNPSVDNQSVDRCVAPLVLFERGLRQGMVLGKSVGNAAELCDTFLSTRPLLLRLPLHFPACCSAYRIGQEKDVVVYRLITCGTVEEKVYRKQVFKGGLSRTGTEDGVQFRYFNQQDMRDLFRLDPAEAESSVTARQLNEEHAGQRQAGPALAEHLEFLAVLEGFRGVFRGACGGMRSRDSTCAAMSSTPKFAEYPPTTPTLSNPAARICAFSLAHA